MIFDQSRNPKRSWSKIGRPDVDYGCPTKIRATPPLDFQTLRALLGQAPSRNGTVRLDSFVVSFVHALHDRT